MKVPIPALNKAMEGSSPTRSETKTVAPNATKRNHTPIIPFFIDVNFISLIDTAKMQISLDKLNKNK